MQKSVLTANQPVKAWVGGIIDRFKGRSKAVRINNPSQSDRKRLQWIKSAKDE
jgi:hypothetical protein